MRVRSMIVPAAVLVLATAAPAVSQMVGTVGGNPGESPQDARKMDQVYDELKDKGSLGAPNVDELAVGADLVRGYQFEDAIPHLEHALARHPRDVTTLIYIGLAHRMAGDGQSGEARDAHYAKALEYYKRGLEIDPRNRTLHEYLGRLYLKMHDLGSAQAELKALEDICPSGCDQRTALGMAVSLAGN